MPIRIVETRSSDHSDDSRIFIGSSALSLLESELQAYCERKVGGRSFLIAGHRGAGKTTLVDAAIQRVADTFLSQRARQPRGFRGTEGVTLRPLLVPLQGPNLLPDSQDGEGTSQASTKTGTTATPTLTDRSSSSEQAAGACKSADAATADSPSCSTETVLIQIILGLYRALADEFIRAYTERVYQGLNWRSLDPANLPPNATLMLELAAQFELDLDEYPGQARLRDYWRRIGVLEQGVLFPSSEDRRVGNGYSELVALASACEAYQRICGHFTRSQETSSDQERQSKAALELEVKGNALLKPLAALLAGGAVGAGLSAAGAPNALSIFGGAIASLLSTLAVRYSASRSKRQAMKRSELFIPDLSVATLDRVLPVLIQRIVRAGLAPVFVVDELDKVDLSDRITDMVKRLKKLVAERAFFCFLTDRKYFEELSGRTADTPYPIEYTYYSHQLFIVYSHHDLHAYLNAVLQPTRSSKESPVLPNKPSPSADAATPNPAAKPSSSAAPAQAIIDDDAIDVQILPYLILHASEMHTIDVRRRLLELRNGSGEVSYSPGDVRYHPSFRYALLIQIAVETALEVPDMLAELRLRPAFLQIARDALYYVSRRWNHCPVPLDLSDKPGRSHFETYLRQRMETSVELARSTQAVARQDGTREPLQEATAAQVSNSDTCRIEPAVVTFLFAQVRALAAALTDIEKVRVPAAGRGIASVILESLPVQPLLHRVAENQYRWHSYRSGRDATAADVSRSATSAPAPSPSVWATEVGIIEEFDLGLSELLKGVDPGVLSNSLGILPTTPAWTATQAACRRLRDSEAAEASYAEIDTDISCIREYTVNLRQNAKAFAQALIFSSALSMGGLIAYSDDYWPLAITSDLLRLRHVSANAVRSKLEQLFQEMAPEDAPAPIPSLDTNLTDKTEVSAWLRRMVELAKDPKLASLTSSKTAAIVDAWKYWKSRLSFATITARDPGVAVFVCALQRIGPGRFLDMDPADMTISRWSEIFLLGINPQKNDPENVPPPWLVLQAAARLGFGMAVSQSRDLMSRIGAAAEDFTSTIYSPTTTGSSALVLSLNSGLVYSWIPNPSFPILFARSNNFDAFRTVPELKQLGFTFLALDGEDSNWFPPPDPKTSAVTTPSNPTDFQPALVETITNFGFSITDNIPVVVSSLAQNRNWSPNFHPISPESPEELFRISQLLKENTPKPTQA